MTGPSKSAKRLRELKATADACYASCNDYNCVRRGFCASGEHAVQEYVDGLARQKQARAATKKRRDRLRADLIAIGVLKP